MDVSTELATFFIALLAALVTVIPVAIGLLKTYLQVQTNKLRLDARPTHDQVSAAIDSKLAELQEGTNGQNQSSSPAGGGGAGSNAGT